MAAATTTTLQNILVRLFPDRLIQEHFFQDQPTLGLMPKTTEFAGSDMRVPIQHAPTSGGSATFSTAQSRKAGTQTDAFIITRKKDYSLFSIENEAIRAGAVPSGRQGLVDTMTREVNGAMNQIKRSIGVWLFRNGGGARGQVGSGGGTTVITLKNRHEIYNFDVGMYLDSSATDGTSGSADGGSVRITKIDRTNYQLTAAGNWDQSLGYFADDDFIFREGDFGNLPTGIDGWLPATVTATPFFGLNRTTDEEKLGGVRVVGHQSKDGTIERTLVRASVELNLMGASPDTVIMNPLDMAILIKEIAAKEQIVKPVSATAIGPKGPIANVSYQGVTFWGATGPQKVLGDRNCPRGVCYMLTMNTWELATLGPCPGWLSGDGNKMLREGSADAIEGRIGLYGNVICRRPGDNARVDISSIPEVALEMAA